VAVSETDAAEIAPLLIERLRTGIKRTDPEFAARWEPCGRDSVLVVATSETRHGPAAQWRVDIAAGTVTIEEELDLTRPCGEAAEAISEAGAEEEAAQDNAWVIIASADTWQQVLTEKVNLSVALRRHTVRYCDQGDIGPVTAEIRVAMLADLLGLTSWGHGSGAGQAVADGTH
jgi:hypothetical protein